MAEAAGTTDPAAGGGAATSTDPAAGVGSGEATGAAGAPDQTGSGDYIQRIRTDPEFAVKEVKNHQARADREAAEKQRAEEWFGRLGSVRDRATGDQVMASIERFSRILDDTGMAQVISEFERTGKMPRISDLDDVGDDYVDPGDERLRAIEQESRQTAGILAQNAIQSHISTLFGNYDFSPDDQKRIIESAKATVNGWSKSAAGRQSIRNLSGEQGLNTVRALLFSQVDDEKIHKAAVAARLRKQKELDGMGTDGPSDLPSDGGEPPPDFAGEGGSVKDVALQALEYARKNPRRI